MISLSFYYTHPIQQNEYLFTILFVLLQSKMLTKENCFVIIFLYIFQKDSIKNKKIQHMRVCVDVDTFTCLFILYIRTNIYVFKWN